MAITIEFEGSFRDRLRISTDSGVEWEANEAWVMYDLTHEGKVGSKFRGASDIGRVAMTKLSRPEFVKAGFQMNQVYEVVERIEDGEDVLVRLKYMGQID